MYMGVEVRGQHHVSSSGILRLIISFLPCFLSFLFLPSPSLPYSLPSFLAPSVLSFLSIYLSISVSYTNMTLPTPRRV